MLLERAFIGHQDLFMMILVDGTSSVKTIAKITCMEFGIR